MSSERQLAYEQGREYLDRLKQPSRAAAAFRRVLELDRQHIDAMYHLGKVLFQIGEVDEAVAAFEGRRHAGRGRGP